jgi:hypothetical protein
MPLGLRHAVMHHAVLGQGPTAPLRCASRGGASVASTAEGRALASSRPSRTRGRATLLGVCRHVRRAGMVVL